MQTTRVHNGHAKNLDFLPFDLKDARKRLKSFGDQATEFIRNKPGMALIGALCLGFVLSRVVNRR